jgi:SAM-dependent methyltransferase
MPSIEDNKKYWTEYDWHQGGEEWSAAFGSTATQWFGALLPRIHRFLPANTILEIAPGFGRWTQFLAGHCNRLIGIDLCENCVLACKQRFAHDSRLSFHQNDGKSLAGIPSRSVDFVFCFDSLVNANAEIIQAYTQEISAKLTDHGVAFIHHSNVRAHAHYFQWLHRIPRGRGWLHRHGLVDLIDFWEDATMSAESMRRIACDAGLACVSQELIPSTVHKTRRTVSCISVLTRPLSRWDKPLSVYDNVKYLAYAAHLKKLGQCYGQ